MTLLNPIWLLLGVPALLSFVAWPMASLKVRVLRGLAVLLVLLSMSGLATQQKRNAGVLVVVSDRSLSMPKQNEARQKGLIDLIQKQQGAYHRLAVVSFGRDSNIDRAPQKGRFAGFLSKVDADGSAITDALQKGLALIPPGTPGRLLVLSDGRWTGRSPRAMAARAAARGIPIDYVTIARNAANDIAILKLDTPDTVTPGESFMFSAWIQVPVKQRVRYVLMRGKKPIAVGQKTLGAGRNRLLFRDKAMGRGTLSYLLKVGGSGKDPMPENNRARAMIGVKGPRQILHITSSGRSALHSLLKSAKLPVVTKQPGSLRWSLRELSRYSSVIFENVPSQRVGRRGMQNLAAWIKSSGAGLMMTGGELSYGTGGYIRSPLEPILPVSMRLRQEHRKLFLALAIVLDRSCSMGARVMGGKTKMDLANLASVQALDLLGPLDELSVLAVDSATHTILPLSRIRDKQLLRERILGIRSMGGGIYVYTGLRSAFAELKKARSSTRHIILFADAADAEEPGAYIKLLKECRKHGITVSVIGLGTAKDSDAAFLKDVARRGKGRIFFTRDPQELPRLFAQDTMVVTKSSFIRSKTPIAWQVGLGAITGLRFPSPPPVGGYNLTYRKSGATSIASTRSKKSSPIAASWQVGLGRALAYTAEVDGNYAGPIARWKHIGDLLSSLARWTAGDHQKLPTPMMLTRKIRRGMGVIELQLDPEKHAGWLSSRPVVQILKGDIGQKPSVTVTRMRWLAPHRLQVTVPLRGRETALATVLLPGRKPITLSPLILPYSPEYKPAALHSTSSLSPLALLAKISSGIQRLDVSGIWKAIPPKVITARIGHWLLLLALLLFLLEILERRSGFFSDIWELLTRPLRKKPALAGDAPPAPRLPPLQTLRPKTSPKAPQAKSQDAAQRQTKAAPQEAPSQAPQEAPSQAPPAPQPPAPSPQPPAAEQKGGGMFGAMQKASKQARKRTRRK